MTDGVGAQYSPAEERALALQLREVTRKVYRGERSEAVLGAELLAELHESLFRGVRDHAGRVRDRGRGSEHLTFGPNRSVANRDCPAQLERAFDEARRVIEHLVAAPGDSAYEPRGFETAVRLHAEIVRIHPFEDGNGRTSRLILNVVLVRIGLRPVEVEVMKAEYNECLNRYFRSRDLQPLTDLLLRTYDSSGLEP